MVHRLAEQRHLPHAPARASRTHLVDDVLRRPVYLRPPRVRHDAVRAELVCTPASPARTPGLGRRARSRSGSGPAAPGDPRPRTTWTSCGERSSPISATCRSARPGRTRSRLRCGSARPACPARPARTARRRGGNLRNRSAPSRSAMQPDHADHHRRVGRLAGPQLAEPAPHLLLGVLPHAEHVLNTTTVGRVTVVGADVPPAPAAGRAPARCPARSSGSRTFPGTTVWARPQFTPGRTGRVGDGAPAGRDGPDRPVKSRRRGTSGSRTRGWSSAPRPWCR